jgi:hypothetical protein
MNTEVTGRRWIELHNDAMTIYADGRETCGTVWVKPLSLFKLGKGRGYSAWAFKPHDGVPTDADIRCADGFWSKDQAKAWVEAVVKGENPSDPEELT